MSQNIISTPTQNSETVKTRHSFISQNIINTSEFPALVSFSKHWETIRDEALNLDPTVRVYDGDGNVSYEEAYKKIIETGKNTWIELWGPAKKQWLGYVLCFEDNLLADYIHDNPLPKTMALFKRLHGVRMATLNIQKPGGFTSVHGHPDLRDKNVLIYHLPLSVPDNWHWLNVEGTFIQHRHGESFIFDGCKDHFSLNFSKKDRLILYLEFHVDRISFDD